MIVTSTWVSNGRVRSDARRSCREHDSSLAIGRPYRPGPYHESPPAGTEGSEYLWETRGLFVLAPPHPKQKKNLWYECVLSQNIHTCKVAAKRGGQPCINGNGTQRQRALSPLSPGLSDAPAV